MMGKGGYCSEIELANINIIILQLDQEALIIALFGTCTLMIIIDVGCFRGI